MSASSWERNFETTEWEVMFPGELWERRCLGVEDDWRLAIFVNSVRIRELVDWHAHSRRSLDMRSTLLCKCKGEDDGKCTRFTHVLEEKTAQSMKRHTDTHK